MVIGTSEILELVSKARAVAFKYPKARVVASATSELWYTPVLACLCEVSHALHLRWELLLCSLVY